MLEIKNVNLNVWNTALLSNINLTLEQGKIYGVLGPNGAGKTTLFKSIRDGKIIKIVENDYNEKELEALYEDIMTSGQREEA